MITKSRQRINAKRAKWMSKYFQATRDDLVVSVRPIGWPRDWRWGRRLPHITGDYLSLRVSVRHGKPEISSERVRHAAGSLDRAMTSGASMGDKDGLYWGLLYSVAKADELLLALVSPDASIAEEQFGGFKLTDGMQPETYLAKSSRLAVTGEHRLYMIFFQKGTEIQRTQVAEIQTKSDLVLFWPIMVLATVVLSVVGTLGAQWIWHLVKR